MYYSHFVSGEEHKRETLVIPVDFSCGYDIYEQLTEQLQGLDIGVLGMVNGRCILSLSTQLQAQYALVGLAMVS